ncbi:TIR domain-containing protein [Pseudomonas sp. PSB1]|uniref:TIR domain-containing protein n=1 Tax=Pseudomonas sp. PSB1 TaxID=477819 RepID=UPI00166054E2|nr:TIR domain-containing protein [Pseudomonas sp. PSB1]MBD0704378.1 hypothetical protein [Pseudomonas sp. PSB1]
MARKCFFSFHYQPDNWRAATVRQIGAIEGNPPAKDNDWETVTRGGEKAIETWILEQMAGRSCAIVLIGAATANRKWIDFEIQNAWKKSMGLLGIYVHGLKNAAGEVAAKGPNPFQGFTIGTAKTPLTSVVKTYDPPGADSKTRYAYIAANIDAWIEDAIAIRSRY